MRSEITYWTSFLMLKQTGWNELVKDRKKIAILVIIDDKLNQVHY